MTDVAPQPAPEQEQGPPPAPPVDAPRSGREAIGASAPAPVGPSAPAPPPNALSRPGWFGWQFPFGIGVAAIVAAAARAGILAEKAAQAGAPGAQEAWYYAAGRIALLAPIAAALGLAAAWVFAKSQRRPLGDWKLAGARILAAVGLFHLVWRLGAAPTGYPWFDGAFAFSLGLACYLGTLLLTFRFRRDELLQFAATHAGFVLGAHAVIWMAPRFFEKDVGAPARNDGPAPIVAPGSGPAGSRPGPSSAPAPAQEPAPKPTEPAPTPPPDAPPGAASGAERPTTP